MANVYVSFLGTNDYLPCIYYKDDKEFRDTRFVQEATLGICCREWTDEDRIIIFTTDEAYQSNPLKENLGASFLIGEKVYGKHLKVTRGKNS